MRPVAVLVVLHVCLLGADGLCSPLSASDLAHRGCEPAWSNFQLSLPTGEAAVAGDSHGAVESRSGSEAAKTTRSEALRQALRQGCGRAGGLPYPFTVLAWMALSAQCQPGTYSSDGTGTGETCKNCGAGKETKMTKAGASSCTACEAGKYSDEDKNTACKACDAGKYRATAGADAEKLCVPCEAGKYVGNVGASTCIDCDPGEYLTQTGADRKALCLDCGAGSATKSSSSGASSCTACEAGKYSDWNYTPEGVLASSPQVGLGGAGLGLRSSELYLKCICSKKMAHWCTCRRRWGRRWGLPPRRRSGRHFTSPGREPPLNSRIAPPPPELASP